MNVYVTDRRSIERGFLVKSTYALISIRDPDAKKARIPKASGLRATLHLAFHDSEPSDDLDLPAEIVMPTEEHARQIWQFVDEHKDSVGAFVVHCHQGMSRSPAVAAAIATYLGLSDGRFWEEHAPNQYLHDMMLKTMPNHDGG
jgi:predicted protein tyrosine phosphatase